MLTFIFLIEIHIIFYLFNIIAVFSMAWSIIYVYIQCFFGHLKPKFNVKWTYKDTKRRKHVSRVHFRSEPEEFDSLWCPGRTLNLYLIYPVKQTTNFTKWLLWQPFLANQFHRLKFLLKLISLDICFRNNNQEQHYVHFI